MNKKEKISNRLKAQIKEGKLYYKSKHIAKDLGMSTNEVGVLLGIMAKENNGLKIQKWGMSRSITWKIEEST